jgi:protein-tyrosine-phosphatase
VPDAFAFEVLDGAGIPTTGLHSKGWDIFGREDSPRMALVITLCDVAAAQECPYWPSQPATAYWEYPDPAKADGTPDRVLEAYRKTLHAIKQRLELLMNLPEEHLQALVLEESARGFSAV